GGQGPCTGAGAGEPDAGAAVARGRHQRRGLPGVPLLRPRRAEAGQGRRRGGRLRRGAVPGGLRRPPRRRRHPGRRDQRHHRAPARQGRQAARLRGHLPQRHHAGPPVPLPPVQDRILAVGEPTERPLRRYQVHQRRPRHLHQRLRRQPDVARQHVGVRAHLHRRHDVQLHQGGGVRTRHHLRPPAGGDEGHHPPERRGVGHTGPHRHLLPPGHHIQLRA
ncbi:hypothetical protein ACJX0J_038101, partial [Zea mays]